MPAQELEPLAPSSVHQEETKQLYQLDKYAVSVFPQHEQQTSEEPSVDLRAVLAKLREAEVVYLHSSNGQRKRSHSAIFTMAWKGVNHE